MSAGRLLVTGAAGFIGSHLVERCVAEGHNVRAFVRYNSSSSWGWLEHSPVRDEVEVVAGDIRDYDSVTRAMEGCEGVFHLAALIGIPYSYTSPLAYIKTNTEGTYNVLEAARRQNVERVVVTSTSEVYGSARYVPMDEAHPLQAQSPYAASKIAADQLGLSYYRSFDLPVRLARPFNTYGPRQSARAVIPTIITQLLSGKREIKLGNLAPTRDLTFVKDTVAGFLAILNEPSLAGEVTNIGMHEETSIGDLAQAIADDVGVEVDIAVDTPRVRPSKSEVTQLHCDNTKIVTTTGWKPTYTLRQGLHETIAWLREHRERYQRDTYHV
jgi:dTDP-glucose 4,6-dehydratase